MEFPRESGVLLHPTSLPGPYGIGEIGPAARDFVDRLADAGQRLWQILPIGPTSYGDSPYQSLSTFAGNHLLISFDQLVEDGLLSARRLASFPLLPENEVDYGPVIDARMDVLASVCRTFNRRAGDELCAEYEAFCEREAYWLDDYALFRALKDAHGGRPWTEWEQPLLRREPKALDQARHKHARAMRDVAVLQFLFHHQWNRLRDYAHERHVRLVGDIPIFVAHDSADVWAHPDLYYLDEQGQPTVIAGVPPDYFSATGQRWGNPLYRWERHAETGYDWWIQRMRKIFEVVDVVRIDHFRGFEAYWEIPAHEETAMNGTWVPGPKGAIFDALNNALGELPIIAEDLGVITPDVEALRDAYAFPGMRILQFSFGDYEEGSTYRPENFPANCVVYTGTHDNDTTYGWFWSEGGPGDMRTPEQVQADRDAVLPYVKTDGREIHWDLIRLAAESKANTAVYPLQDVLGLGSDARMNVPGREGGNWRWRFSQEQLTSDAVTRLKEVTQQAGRILS